MKKGAVFNPVKVRRDRTQEEFRRVFGRYPSANELDQFTRNSSTVFGTSDEQRERTKRAKGRAEISK